jgi:transposase
MIDTLDTQIDEQISPYAAQRDRLTTIPGIGQRAAQTIIAEIGVDMSRFPSPDHLASWAGLCPGNHESAGKRRSGATRNGNPHLATVLVEAAWATSHTRTRLGARYRRLHRRFGKAGGKKAAVAIAHTLLVIVWHLLAHDTTYTDLGDDYYTQRDDPERRKNRLLRELRELGYDAELTPLAA